jgi:Leucine Rich repeat
MPSGRKPDIKRLAPRISVRALVVFIILTGLILARIVHRARVQHDVVKALTDAGGTVAYACERDVGTGWQATLPGWKKFLVDSIGIDYVSHVVFFQIEAKPDDVLAHRALLRLGALDRLESLNFMGRGVDDSILATLDGMTSIRSMMLQHSAVTDIGIAGLASLPNLETLYLNGTHVSNSGLGRLEGAPRLRQLALDGIGVTSDGLTGLRKLASLRDLVLIGSEFTDGTVEGLGELAQLRVLGLKYTQLSDRGLAHLMGLVHLETLQLAGSEVTDAGLKHLGALPALREIALNRTQLSEAAVQNLQSASPGVTVRRWE